jgi:hypothetical protein
MCGLPSRFLFALTLSCTLVTLPGCASRPSYGWAFRDQTRSGLYRVYFEYQYKSGVCKISTGYMPPRGGWAVWDHGVTDLPDSGTIHWTDAMGVEHAQPIDLRPAVPHVFSYDGVVIFQYTGKTWTASSMSREALGRSEARES